MKPLEGRKNNERLRGLEKNESILDDWFAFNEQVREQGKTLVSAIENHDRFCEGLWLEMCKYEGEV